MATEPKPLIYVKPTTPLENLNIAPKPVSIFGLPTGGGDDVEVSWDDVQDKPEEFAPEAHTHDISDVDGLEARLSAVEALEARIEALENAATE